MIRSYFLLVLIAVVGIILASGEVHSNNVKTKAEAITTYAPTRGVESEITTAKRSLRAEATTEDDHEDLSLLIFGDSTSTSYNFSSSDEERAFNIADISAKLNAAAQKFKNNPAVLKITSQLKTATDKLKSNPTFIRASEQIKAKTAQIKANPRVIKLQAELKVLQKKVMEIPGVKTTLDYIKNLKKASTPKSSTAS
ncbi:hypothetical protein PHYBOEH_006810 [Phytophthora boehmeriae]|uniref:RxLR effector protein n=1 Tax=Phytophthora boehmeriae TaxID=109152 RepID=A0A8T1WCU1_9STRA|nr:hypothetical protein PHYBOEH_006810 [Phytophthora boehmeriae]